MRHKAIKLATMTLCFLFALTFMQAPSIGTPRQAAKSPAIITQDQPQDPPINITFRLLAIEAYYDSGSMLDGRLTGGADEPMKSAQYLISTLLGYPNWQNKTDPSNNFRYISHIHLLSADPNASKNFPSFYRGTPTNASVNYEITHFLANTSAGESNKYTIRILYYCGHSNVFGDNKNKWQINKAPGWLNQNSLYLALGNYTSDPAAPAPPSPSENALNPTGYQELWDTELSTLLDTGDLATNNCTLVILDSCHSGAAIPALSKTGRVILTSCSAQNLSYGWLTPVKAGTADHWSWFTGQNSTNCYFNSTVQTPWPGGIGIIGAIKAQADPDKNGWGTTDEIFQNDVAWNTSAMGTTYNYSLLETMSTLYNDPAGLPQEKQTPEMGSGVLLSFIPLVQYNASKPFPCNGDNSTFEGPLPSGPKFFWSSYHMNSAHTGYSGSGGPTTGNHIWTQTGFNTNASVVVSSQEAIVPTQSGVVYGLELTTGTQIWEFNAGSQIIATPAVDCTTHVIYVATFGGGGGGGGPGGILYAINEPTGRVLWDWSAPTGVGFYASPVVADGRIYVATYSGTSNQGGIYAFNQTSGQPLWGRILNSPVKSSPAVNDGRIYVATTAVGSTPARLHALAESTGLEIWNYSFGLSNVISSPSVASGLVLIGCMGGGGGGSGGAGLYAFPESGGTWRWWYPTSSPVSSSPAVDENRGIVVGCSEGAGVVGGSVFALPLNSIGTISSPIWSSPPESVKMSSPAISGNGLVYVGTFNNQFLCLNETSGVIVWSYGTASPVMSSPAITEDHVLIGAGSTLYSFGSAYPDVAVTSITPSRSTVIIGLRLYVTVNVTNKGDLAQSFNVTLYSGTYWAATATQTLQVRLAGKSSTTVTFSVVLSTRGAHVFAAYAWPVEYEINTLNNYCFGNSVVYASALVLAYYGGWGHCMRATPF